MDSDSEVRFSNIRSTGELISSEERIIEAAKQLAEAIGIACQNGREKALALTKLEESVMWANTAILRGK